MEAEASAAAAAGAGAVELRLDYLSALPTREELRRLIGSCSVETIATLRPQREGGLYRGDERRRLEVLRSAAEAGASFVDVEHDVPPQDWPGGARVILSQHDFQSAPDDIPGALRRLAGFRPAVVKLAFRAAGGDQAIAALSAAGTCELPAICLAMGPGGVASRLLGGKVGAFGTFAALRGGKETAGGQTTLAEMRDLYRWEATGPQTRVYGVVGCPVEHSLSPAVHNAAFAALDVDAIYLPLRVEPGREAFERFLSAALAADWLDLRGLSVTIPHKQNALEHVSASQVDELSLRIGAINTLRVADDRTLRGHNTDYDAAVRALCDAMDLSPDALVGRSVGVLGAGGVARAIVAALTRHKAKVTIYNRTVDRATALAGEFRVHAAPLEAEQVTQDAVVINCTPVGMFPVADASPVAKIGPATRVVFDTIYNPRETELLRRARAAGCTCISGMEMFLNQALAQFRLWTGRDAPREVMERAAR